MAKNALRFLISGERAEGRSTVQFCQTVGGWIVRSGGRLILINPRATDLLRSAVAAGVSDADEVVVVLATRESAGLDLEALYSLPRDATIVASTGLPHTLEQALEFVNLRVHLRSSFPNLLAVTDEQDGSHEVEVADRNGSCRFIVEAPIQLIVPGTASAASPQWTESEPGKTYRHQAAKPSRQRISRRGRRFSSHQETVQAVREARAHLQTRASLLLEILPWPDEGETQLAVPGSGRVHLTVELYGGPTGSRFRYALDGSRCGFLPIPPVAEGMRTAAQVALYLEDYLAVTAGACLMSDLYPEHLVVETGSDGRDLDRVLAGWLSAFGPLHEADSVLTHFRGWAQSLIISETLAELEAEDV